MVLFGVSGIVIVGEGVGGMAVSDHFHFGDVLSFGVLLTLLLFGEDVIYVKNNYLIRKTLIIE